MTADGTQVPGGGRRADSGPEARAGSSPWPLVLPLALLIILGMAGLRGSVVQPRWNGPWHRDGVAVGIALEVLLGVLLVMTLRRRSASLRTPPVAGSAVAGSAVAAKLRTVLIFVLSGGMIAVAVGVIIGLHLSVFTSAGPQAPNPVPTRTLLPRKFPTGAAHVTLGHFPVGPLLYGLLIVALLAAVWLSVWWSRRFR
ncbi:MAG TPA: hypothetical protein VG123_24995, partial [Streptosporangiaceae bacterium]|nr:hypothetical protein [Streptosporangiaceae bacterium]